MPDKVFEINEYLTVKQEGKETVIYVAGERFDQCKALLLNIPIEDVGKFDEIESIDEVADMLKWNPAAEHGQRGIKYDIPPETEFFGHCSNLQAWYENDYNTNLLHSNLAFPLLEKLTMVGDLLAKTVFKEEIAKRFETGTDSAITFLLERGYSDYLDKDELLSIMSTILEGDNKSLKNNVIYSIMSNLPQENLEDYLAKILKTTNTIYDVDVLYDIFSELISGVKRRQKNDTNRAIEIISDFLVSGMEKFSNDYRFSWEMVEELLINHQILEKVILQWATKGIVPIYDSEDETYSEYGHYISSVSEYLTTKEFINYLDSCFKNEIDIFQAIIYNSRDLPHSKFNEKFSEGLLKGLNHPDRLIKLKAEKFVKELGSSLLPPLNDVISNRYNNKPEKSHIKAFSIILNLPFEFLHNIIFKIEYAWEVGYLFLKKDFDSYRGNDLYQFYPVLADLPEILARFYFEISNQINKEFEKNSKINSTPKSNQSKFMQNLMEILQYLSKDIMLKGFYNKKEIKALLIELLNRESGGRLQDKIRELLFNHFQSGNLIFVRPFLEEERNKFFSDKEILQMILKISNEKFLSNYKIIFSLLKNIIQSGNENATRMLKLEIENQFSKWNPTIIEYLCDEKYLNFLENQEILKMLCKILEDDNKFLQSYELVLNMLKKFSRSKELLTTLMYKKYILIRRFENLHPSVITFMYKQGYLNDLAKKALITSISKVLVDDDEFLRNYELIYAILENQSQSGDSIAEQMLKDVIEKKNDKKTLYSNKLEKIDKMIKERRFIEAQDELLQVIPKIKKENFSSLLKIAFELYRKHEKVFLFVDF